MVLGPLISTDIKSITNKILKKIGVEEQKTNFTVVPISTHLVIIGWNSSFTCYKSLFCRPKKYILYC